MSVRELRITSGVLWLAAGIMLVGGWFVVDTAFTVLAPTAVVLAAIGTGMLANRRARKSGGELPPP